MFFDCADLNRVSVKGHRNQHRLHRHGIFIERIFELLIQDAFVCCMHIDQHQPFAVLCEYIHTVQLGQRKT